MLPSPTPRIFLFIVGAAIALTLYAHTGFSFALSSLGLASSPGLGDEILPIPSRTYVISLPQRRDRYKEMERLRARLSLRWTYAVAEDSQSQLVGRIMSQVQSMRRAQLKMNEHPLNTTVSLPFDWPSMDNPASSPPFEATIQETPLPPALPAGSDSEPLTCATENFTLFPYSAQLPEYKILSRSRIACWHSHLSVIQHLSTQASEKAALVLEDDVDMEVDIKERLLSVWDLLPLDWDIVFLGHCWSNESYHPALEPATHTTHANYSPRLRSLRDAATEPPSPDLHATRLHPSYGPLCTHAYALSPAGVKRLLLHLTHAPFAYSRAIDHALAWLVQSGRLRAYSVVPSVVVQRKTGDSDVAEGKGSQWREHLAHGVLANECSV
ncbi:hypothetical protein DFH06DRAFT_1428833 [Mycena polygramma]|nr:hypothetical protein DFH06DRAFT_1428833 [Mycena polygramma]